MYATLANNSTSLLVGYSYFALAVVYTSSTLPIDFSLGNNGGLLDFSGYMGNGQ
jgi:hypothetical protein